MAGDGAIRIRPAKIAIRNAVIGVKKIMIILQIIVVIIALLGAWLNARKNIYGFCCWLLSNGFWTVHNIIIREYAQAFLYFVFLGIAIYGLYKWSQGNSDGQGTNRSE